VNGKIHFLHLVKFEENPEFQYEVVHNLPILNILNIFSMERLFGVVVLTMF
jgi:hypothetical protein